MKLQKHLREIAENYHYYLVDQWGVLHNGVDVFPDAQIALRALKNQNKKIIILSNSSKPKKFTAEFLYDLGFDESYYDDIITSGSDFQDNILQRQDAFYQDLGTHCYLISWSEDMVAQQGELQHAALHDLPICVVSALQDADFILCAGVNRDKNIADYEPLLQEAQKRQLPMVCINPDKFSVAPDGSLEICPGAIAAHYEEHHHGNVRWHGKPYPAIYQSASRIIGHAVDGRTLAIGDSLHHDIQGIKQAGGYGLFITSGIAWQELGLSQQYEDANEQQLQNLYQENGIFPDYAQTKLIW